MDLNQLYHDHQVSLIRADQECVARQLSSYRDETERLGALIETRQTLLGAAAAGWSVTGGVGA